MTPNRATLLACFSALLFVHPLRADEASDTAAARALTIEGIKLADAGDCKTAIDKLQRAAKLHDAPTIFGRLGECLVKEGQIVRGTEMLQRVVRQDIPANAPPAFKLAKERAEGVLKEALPKVAKLKIQLSPSSTKDAKVTVGGEPVSEALLGIDRPTDPGEHVIEASAPGFVTASVTVRLAAGESKEVTLKLEPALKAGVVPTATPPAPSAAAPPPSDPKPRVDKRDEPLREEPPQASKTPYVLLGIGVVGVVAGAGLGYLAMKKRDDLDKVCKQKVCAASNKPVIDEMKQFGNASTVAFGIGAVGIGVGAIMLASRKAPEKETAGITPFVGIGTVGATGRFW